MKFRTEASRHRMTGRVLVYRPEDYSFDIEPHIDSYASAVVNELSLALDSKGKVTKVFGYCPFIEWRKSLIANPSANIVDVYKDEGGEILAGVAWSVNPDRRWPVYVDPQSGWVYLDSGNTATSLAEIMTGVILGLDDSHQLVAVLLRPRLLPKFQ
jgi:hypothetical protein